MNKTTGTVVSTKMNKTVVVEIKIMSIHPLYKKRIWKKRKFLVHDETGVKIGDTVTFVECKPISKKVHWTIINKTEIGSEKVEAGPKKLEVGKVVKKSRKVAKK